VIVSHSSQQQARKSRAIGPAKLRFDKYVKTFQRERLTRQRREEEGGAALKSAAADIGRIVPLCNAARLMQGMRVRHNADLTNAADGT
jgi:hypothetical protein